MEGSLYYREDRFDPFTVVLFKALQVLAFLFFIALLMMKPSADPGKVVKRAEFIITMTWPDRHPDDVDLYVQDPAGKLVWYNQRDVGLMVLERDDRGDTNDFAMVESKKIPLPIREELVSIRGLMAGEYTVNVHLYHHLAAEPVPVSVKVEKPQPGGRDRGLPHPDARPHRRGEDRISFHPRGRRAGGADQRHREVADRYHRVEEDVPQPAERRRNRSQAVTGSDHGALICAGVRDSPML